MSVESWSQGNDNQRQKTLIASGEANVTVPAGYFDEPGGSAAPAKATGAEPPDASNKPHSKGGAKSKPGAAKTPTPSVTPKGE